MIRGRLATEWRLRRLPPQQRRPPARVHARSVDGPPTSAVRRRSCATWRLASARAVTLHRRLRRRLRTAPPSRVGGTGKRHRRIAAPPSLPAAPATCVPTQVPARASKSA